MGARPSRNDYSLGMTQDMFDIQLMQALQNAIDYIDSSLEVRYIVEECKALWGSCDRATILLCVHNSWK